VTANRLCAHIPPSEAMRNETLERVRQGLMAQADTVLRKERGATASGFSFVPALGALDYLAATEPRSPDEFRSEVEEYLRDVDTAMEQSLLQAVTRVGTPLRLKLINPGEQNLAQVEVVLSLPDTVVAQVADEDAEVDWPDPPEEYGTATNSPFARSIVSSVAVGAAMRAAAFMPAHIPTPDIEQKEGRTIIRFVPVDLRPHGTVTLDPITVYSTARQPRPSSGSGV